MASMYWVYNQGNFCLLKQCHYQSEPVSVGFGFFLFSAVLHSVDNKISNCVIFNIENMQVISFNLQIAPQKLVHVYLVTA